MKLLSPKIPLVFLFVMFFSWSTYSQTLSNSELIRKHQINNTRTDSVRKALNMKDKSFIARYNPVTLFGTGALFVYQNVVSPQLDSDCLYHPSCSDFTKQAIRHYGFIKGLSLGADRLSRCSELAEGEIARYRMNKEGNFRDPPARYK